ncbi:MAG: transglycosylase SLT domain-containing protein [Acidobacteria bacterium]|nr:transglycosylase SLT domain-containing protein [Acidobacteriota bacterium]
MDPQQHGWTGQQRRRRFLRNPTATLSLALFVAAAVLTSADALAGQGIATQVARDTLTLPAPTYPEVVHLYRAGSHTAALTRLDLATGDERPAPLEAAVLRASILGAAGRGAEADAVWREVIDREVWMRTFARRARVAGLAERGEPAAAASILTELQRADPVRHLDLTVAVATAHLDRDEFEPAGRLFQLALSHERHGALADQARLGLAAALERMGDVDRAVAILREAQLEHRTGAAYDAALAAERRLNERRDVPRAAFAVDEYRALTSRLRSDSRYEEAAAVIAEWRQVQPEAGDRLDVEVIGVRYDSRANQEAVDLCVAFASKYPASPLLPDVKLTEFRLAVRMGDNDAARRLGLHLFEGRVPGATAGQQFSAGELLAAHLVAVGDVESGLALYRQLLQRATSPDAQRLMLWKAGVAALRAGDNERALTNLRALNERTPTGDLQPAGQYWQAVAEMRVGQTEEATLAFRALVQTQPYGYYGLQAQARLVALGAEAAVPDSPPRRFPSLALDPTSTGEAEFKAAMVLARAGLITDTAWYLQRLSNTRRGDTGLALLAARASADAGDHRAVATLLVNHFADYLQRPAEALPEDFYSLVYPRPFLQAVEQAASGRELNPAILFSLMRQESRFDPNARSVVGALGLFQIMPYTATELGPRAGLDDLSAVDFEDEAVLLQPRVNAAIAATLASDLLALFGGALAPVIASYNAGEERVAIWWESARDLPEDLFVDTIPYSETRRFVREVLANVAGYRRVWETPPTPTGAALVPQTPNRPAYANGFSSADGP